MHSSPYEGVVFRPFNRAAPFRERLDALRRAAVVVSHLPSIVPPPFGSG